MKNLFKNLSKKEKNISFKQLDKTQLKQVIGGTDEADKVTFKAKEGATLLTTTETIDIKQVSTADGPRY